MAEPSLLKVGFGLSDDLRKLRACHPSLANACRAAPVRELSDFYKVTARSGHVTAM